MAEGCRERVGNYKIDDEGVPTRTTREQVRELYHVREPALCTLPGLQCRTPLCPRFIIYVCFVFQAFVEGGVVAIYDELRDVTIGEK